MMRKLENSRKDFGSIENIPLNSDLNDAKKIN
jgi:hypothetical protein